MKRISNPALAMAVACAVAGPATVHAAGRPVVAGHAFDPAVALPIAPNVASAVAIGDVTGDLRDDVVVVTSTNNFNRTADDSVVMIYRQAPDGTLLAPLRFPHEPNPANRDRFGVALGHFNNDRILDIVVGDGDGFTLLQTSPSGFVSSFVLTNRAAEVVAVLDINLDGNDDVIGQSFSSGATLLYGDGFGSFFQTPVATAGAGYNDVKTGDLNGDGSRDVLLTSGQGPAEFSIHPTAPAGGWLPAVKVPFPAEWSRPWGGAIGDFNDDGIADIATTDGGHNNDLLNKPAVHVFAGLGIGTFAAGSSVATHHEPGSLAAADLDGNGLTDLAVYHGLGFNNVGYYLQGLTGLEAERLLPAPIASSVPRPQSIAVGDIDSNGCPDVVVADWPGVSVYKGQGCRRSPHDFDLDRRSDILWRNPATGANVVWKAANNTKTLDVMDVANTAWQVVGQGDFDGDAKSDLVWRNASNGANVIWRAGSNAAQIPLVGVYNPAWTVAGVGDFNGDGRADLFWRNVQNGQHVIWYSANAATQAVLASVPNVTWQMVGIGDFDGDRRSDLLWRNSGSGANQIWRSGNSGTQLAVTGVYNPDWKVQGVGDFDGDGRSDIFWRNTANGANTIWRSASSAQQVAVLGVTSQFWRVVAVADYDADGRSDLLWRNTGNGSNTIWRSGNAATQLPVQGVSNQQWQVVP